MITYNTKLFLNLKSVLVLIAVATLEIACSCANADKPQGKEGNKNKDIVNEGMIKEVETAAAKYLQELPVAEASWMGNEFNTVLETLKKLQKGEKAVVTGSAADGAVYLGKPEVIKTFIDIVKKDNPEDKKLLDGLKYRLDLTQKVRRVNKVSSFVSSQELERTRYNLKGLLAALHDLENPPDYNPEFKESMRKMKAEHEALINLLRETTRQAKIKRATQEEREKRAAEECRKSQERMEANIKKQRKIAEKRGLEFMAGAEKLDVEGIQDYIRNMQQDLAEVSIATPLSKEQQEDIRFIVEEINKKIKELQGACKNITYNINHPDLECRRDYDQEDLEIAQKLLEELKHYKGELGELLEARGEKLADYETSTASEKAS